MMKKNKLLSIALVTIMALTVVSGAGMLKVQAALPTSAEIANALDCSDLGWTFTPNTYTAGSTASAYVEIINGYGGLNNNHIYLNVVSGTGTAQIETTAPGPGQVTFNWDYLQAGGDAAMVFLVDGVVKATAPYASWQDSEPITVAAGQVLTWRATATSVPGNDAFITGRLDNLRWEPASVSKETVLQDLAKLRSTVMTTPNSAFYSNTKVALLAVIDAATLQAKYGKFGAAAYNLQSKFIPRVDGCALRMTPDTTDLVRTCPAQAPLYEQANSLVQDLQWLQANPP